MHTNRCAAHLPAIHRIVEDVLQFACGKFCEHRIEAQHQLDE
jgi:hypothetical protein